jgi:hypothetical protein
MSGEGLPEFFLQAGRQNKRPTTSNRTILGGIMAAGFKSPDNDQSVVHYFQSKLPGIQIMKYCPIFLDYPRLDPDQTVIKCY